MDKIYIIYWTQTGNTQSMAQALAEGVKGAGAEPELLEVSKADVNLLKEAKAFALGCPAMGAETLEESEMEPFVEEVAKICAGKKIALFGSYGWGDGEWMREWTDRMIQAGAAVVNGEGCICQEEPDQETLDALKQLGITLVEVA